MVFGTHKLDIPMLITFQTPKIFSNGTENFGHSPNYRNEYVEDNLFVKFRKAFGRHCLHLYNFLIYLSFASSCQIVCYTAFVNSHINGISAVEAVFA